MAYPCGGVNNDKRVASIIKDHTKIKYARTITSNYRFSLQNNLYQFNPTVFYLDLDKLFTLAKSYLEQEANTPPTEHSEEK